MPHSEIHGSKLILSSPWLIAEYHVFHRLLLPRHSPNALFALDLIQKKKDRFNVLPPIRLLEDNLDPQTAGRVQDVSPTRETEAGKKLSSLIPDQKHTFTRPLSKSGQRVVHLAYLPCRKQASLLWLVYLTWTTRRFQSRYVQKTEETVK